MRVAQTNLQLIMEMNEFGYSDDEIRLVGEAYNVAARAYVGMFRATGKPLIAHVVGTASLLVRCGCQSEALAAAILHAAPPDGDFGLGSWRRVVTDRVGTDVVEIVDAYDALHWTYTITQIEELLESADVLAGAQREAVIVRIANEIEDYIDDAVAHYGRVDDPGRHKSAAFRRQYVLDTGPRMAALASALNVPFLADCFAELRESLEAELKPPAWPRLNEASTAMFVAAPQSYRLRPAIRLLRPLRRVRSKGVRGTLTAVLRRVRRRSSTNA